MFYIVLWPLIKLFAFLHKNSITVAVGVTVVTGGRQSSCDWWVAGLFLCYGCLSHIVWGKHFTCHARNILYLYLNGGIKEKTHKKGNANCLLPFVVEFKLKVATAATFISCIQRIY